MATGAAVLADAIPLLRSGAEASLASWLVAGLAALSGAGLVIGALTPAMAAGVVLSALAMAFTDVPHVRSQNWPSLLLDGANAIALAMLGPGALSIDACLFGRREIVVRDAARRRARH
ncbi:hypothetical protein [Luteitalea sp. TBR-22]|uniref:hypothetical protein n=1 Tax=Luteitalea sp. TBR-22 TaxID=2802971 RepID=UPI001EF45F34|nr:hypothetical protein [Luteitalea sp. TBR-22]